MILKFVYHTTGYYTSDNAFFVNFENNTISRKSKKCDREVSMKKSGQCDSLMEFFEKRGFTVIDEM